ncbi:hypothetical protein [Persephonella sp.]
MRTRIFKVEGFDITDPEWGRRSAGSFKLDLRNACKQSELYWKKLDSPYVKNLGQLVFGVPDKWKGLFEMRYQENDTTADIEVFLDRRLSMFPSEKEDIIRLIKEGLELLKKEKIIREFEKIE